MGDRSMVTRDGMPTSRIAGSLLRAVRAVAAAVDLRKLQELAPTLAADLAGADHAWLLLSSGQSTLRIASCHGEEAPAPGPAEFRFPPSGPADESLEPRALTDSELLAWLGESWRGARGGVFVLVPLATGSERRAFILVHTANPVPGEAILEDLAVFAVSLAGGLRRAELQESLVSVQHLRAVGELVGGMTHELNNALTAMSGYVQVLQGMDADRLLENRGLLGKIFGQALQCTLTLSRLARFARQSSDGAPMANLLALVEDTLALKAYELRRERIDLRVDIAGGIRLPRIDSAQLQQILVNLLDNAIRAMAGSDVRTLELQAREQEDSTLLLIRDSGPGIPGAIRESIFDPGFTTGGPVAAGLGLPASIRLLEASGATVSVESEEGRGSTFTLHLPSQDAAGWASAAPTKMEPGKG